MISFIVRLKKFMLRKAWAFYTASILTLLGVCVFISDFLDDIVEKLEPVVRDADQITQDGEIKKEE